MENRTSNALVVYQPPKKNKAVYLKQVYIRLNTDINAFFSTNMPLIIALACIYFVAQFFCLCSFYVNPDSLFLINRISLSANFRIINLSILIFSSLFALSPFAKAFSVLSLIYFSSYSSFLLYRTLINDLSFADKIFSISARMLFTFAFIVYSVYISSLDNSFSLLRKREKIKKLFLFYLKTSLFVIALISII